MHLKIGDPRIAPYIRSQMSALRAAAVLPIKDPPALYLGVLGHANLGDEAMWSLAKRSIHREVLAGGVDYFSQRLVLRALASRGSPILIGGGTLLLSPPIARALSSVVRKGTVLATFGTGALDPAFWGSMPFDSRQAWLKICDCCQLLGVRSQESAQLLNDIGIRHAEVVGDPALAYATGAPLPGTVGTIGVNVGTAHNRVWGGDERGPLARIAEALKSMLSKGWKIAFFNVWPRDRAAIIALAHAVGIRRPTVYEEFRDAQIFQQQLQQCQLLLGTKLHSIILSVASGRPTIALGQSPKVAEFMDCINFKHQHVRWDEIRAESLVELLDHTATDSEQLGRSQWSACVPFRETFHRYLARVNDLLAPKLDS